ncbi:effector-associated constant component EACC1 [Actinokineospora globicatena]|uniref:effector-associated constant component EACC1 n=1 Tax=Actinokineospora globicatena TaxID=103729 RepID=UPI0020A4E00C|nr:hypothetical protein [Actinokineospora globicatena]MCP2305148.1 hypothetical protein [Actinokineospora globicatena]GLW80616.1 hypothetical protein Aglo01_50970 [Actinokineospora globicatena]GLW87444.1 hypothetical protein Aglo02_50830 [Actinokineospora globicatena]
MTEAALTGADDDLRELANWLRDEDELRGRVRLRNAPVREGDMGVGIDALTIALGSGGAGTVLIRSVLTYLTTRRKAVVVDLELKDGDKSFSAKLTNESHLDEVLAQADKFFHP